MAERFVRLREATAPLADRHIWEVWEGETLILAGMTKRAADDEVRRHNSVDGLEQEIERLTKLTEQLTAERDSFRRTLADMVGVHPATIVAPVE